MEANGKTVSISPSDRFELRCHNFFDHPLVGHQCLSLGVTPEAYAAEIAPARTFGFEYELDQMRDMGLIRGASLENAVCFTREGIANPAGLRFADECCRHKALDLIGDLALIGKPLLGLVIAEKAGHAMHAALVSKIMSDSSLYEIVTLESERRMCGPSRPSCGVRANHGFLRSSLQSIHVLNWIPQFPDLVAVRSLRPFACVAHRVRRFPDGSCAVGRLRRCDGLVRRLCGAQIESRGQQWGSFWIRLADKADASHAVPGAWLCEVDSAYGCWSW